MIDKKHFLDSPDTEFHRQIQHPHFLKLLTKITKRQVTSEFTKMAKDYKSNLTLKGNLKVSEGIPLMYLVNKISRHQRNYV